MQRLRRNSLVGGRTPAAVAYRRIEIVSVPIPVAYTIATSAAGVQRYVASLPILFGPGHDLQYVCARPPLQLLFGYQ